jgi:hypothetical protein
LPPARDWPQLYGAHESLPHDGDYQPADTATRAPARRVAEHQADTTAHLGLPTLTLDSVGKS